jgi:SAM-dependent methyltransferase
MVCTCGGDENRDVRSTVRDAYGKIARQGGSCCGPPSCCGTAPPGSGAAAGYNSEELAGLPDGADMGLSCGNPAALAALRPGEIVLLPVADASVDVVISNCVINLSPDKAQVWREIARVLRPGGRVSVSDLALIRPLPQALRQSVEALVGCVAGAALVDETREMVRAAGFVGAVFETRSDYIDALAQGADPLYREIAARLPPDTKPSDFVTSLHVLAKKPSTTTGA